MIHTVKVHPGLSVYLVNARLVEPSGRCFTGSVQSQLDATEAPERALLYKVLFHDFLLSKLHGRLNYFPLLCKCVLFHELLILV